jgi:hypothetical protein
MEDKKEEDRRLTDRERKREREREGSNPHFL